MVDVKMDTTNCENEIRASAENFIVTQPYVEKKGRRKVCSYWTEKKRNALACTLQIFLIVGRITCDIFHSSFFEIFLQIWLRGCFMFQRMFINLLEVKICPKAKNSDIRSVHFEVQNDDPSNPYKINNDIKGAIKKLLR